ncbi:Heavy metal-associated isoprenylated plant protein 39 [Linum perenne]
MVSNFDLRLQQVVLKLYLHDDKDKQRALKRVTGISAVDSVSMDMKEKKLTVTRDVDPMIKKEKGKELLTLCSSHPLHYRNGGILGKISGKGGWAF